MRYSTEPRFRKYIKGYGFLSFARKFGDKYGKKLMDTATKTGIDAAKTASKRVVQKTAEATGDLIGNKIADKITSIGKPKEKEKTKEIEEIYIWPEKRQQIIDDLRFFWAQNVTPLYKNGISKNCKFSRHNLWWWFTKICAYIAAKGNIIVDKKTFAANDFDTRNNTAPNATATDTANNNAFGEKKVGF